MRYKLGCVLAVGGLAALAFAPAAFAGWRESGVCDVRSADFPTIQSAIDQVDPPCLTVRLPATRDDFPFREQVTIPRSLTLAGQSFKQGLETIVTRLHPPPVAVDSNVLINIVGARTRVKIKHIIIEGFTGYGVWAGRDTRVTIRDCVFRDMGTAVHVGGPLVPKAKVGITGHSISNCRFDGYQEAAIVVEGEGTTATIENNLISGAGLGNSGGVRPTSAAAPTAVVVTGGATATINRNNLVDNSRDGGGGAAIVINGGGARGQVISYNNIDRNDIGVVIEGTSGVRIFRNGLLANDIGLAIGPTAPSDANTIQLNRIENGYLGLHLGQSSGNTVSRNDLLTHISHGAFLSPTATKNRLYRNRAQGNGAFGFVDQSLGTGTAGTANTYTTNICPGNDGGGSSPAGLCK